jgi:hypothetical protein
VRKRRQVAAILVGHQISHIAARFVPRLGDPARRCRRMKRERRGNTREPFIDEHLHIVGMVDYQQ